MSRILICLIVSLAAALSAGHKRIPEDAREFQRPAAMGASLPQTASAAWGASIMWGSSAAWRAPSPPIQVEC